DDRRQVAYAIYEAAASLAEPQRQQYVDAAAPDAEIAAKVMAMLAERQTAGDSNAFRGAAATTVPAAHAVPTILPGGAVVGGFVVTGLVGQGGIGTVYSAHDPELNREVALKVIPPETKAFGTETFFHEAQAASALNHPNIVTVHEVIRSGHTVAIAMEL